MTRKDIKYRPETDRWIELRDLAADLGVDSLNQLISLVIDEQLPALRARAERQRRERAAT